MKILLPLLLLFFSLGLQAQDIIITLTGDELKVKVTEITLNDVVYKPLDSLQSPALTIPKKSVFLIKYANGTKDIITPFSTGATTPGHSDPKAMYERGRRDARKNYRGNGAMWGSAASILVIGIPGPVIIGAIPPKIKFTQDIDASLLQNAHYTSGYKAEAHRRKIGKAATGAGIGLGAILVVASILFSSVY